MPSTAAGLVARDDGYEIRLESGEKLVARSVIIAGRDSADQAATWLDDHGRQVRIVIRGEELSTSIYSSGA